VNISPKRDVVRGGMRTLHNEELHNLYSLPSIIRIIESRGMIWAEHVAQIGEEEECIYKVSSNSFCTFIFSKKMERAGGVGVEDIVVCHVTSEQGKPVDLAVSVSVATKQ
jgi:hypothetical protein